MRFRAFPREIRGQGGRGNDERRRTGQKAGEEETAPTRRADIRSARFSAQPRDVISLIRIIENAAR